MQSFIQKFRRITDSTSYIPEIDGLRFLAIFLVVAVMHSWNYINVELNQRHLLNEYWRKQILEGGSGVPLFYVISGFILSQPFIKSYQKNAGNLDIRHYYIRRLTRLEPPYIIALIIFFIAYVWILHMYSFGELFPNFLISVFYLNGPLYQSKSLILPVAWSLEVEVQFYLIAPLIFQCFKIKHSYLRWGLYMTVISLGLCFWSQRSFPFVFNLLHFFFTGILLCDLYYNNVVLIQRKKLGMFVGICSVIGILCIPSVDNPLGVAFKLLCMFSLVHLTLTNSYLRTFFTWKFIPVIGGMCYSIYLLHLGIISLTGRLIKQVFISTGGAWLGLLFYVIMLIMILVVAGLYFLLIEKPFMKPIDFRKAFKRKNLPLTNT